MGDPIENEEGNNNAFVSPQSEYLEEEEAAMSDDNQSAINTNGATNGDEAQTTVAAAEEEEEECISFVSNNKNSHTQNSTDAPPSASNKTKDPPSGWKVPNYPRHSIDFFPKEKKKDQQQLEDEEATSGQQQTPFKPTNRNFTTTASTTPSAAEAEAGTTTEENNIQDKKDPFIQKATTRLLPSEAAAEVDTDDPFRHGGGGTDGSGVIRPPTFGAARISYNSYPGAYAITVPTFGGGGHVESSAAAAAAAAAAQGQPPQSNPENGNINDGLMEATPVQENDVTVHHHDMEEAMPVDLYGSVINGRRSSSSSSREVHNDRQRCRQNVVMFSFFWFLSVGVAAILGFIFGRTGGGSGNDSSSTTTTLAPVISTIIPTSAKMSPGDVLMSLLLPHDDMLEALTIPDSAQQRAMEWLLNDTYVEEYTTVRLVQRYALAVLYYQTGGDNWDYNTHWLSYEHHECDWYQFDFPNYWIKKDVEFDDLYHPLISSPACPNSSDPMEGSKLDHLWLAWNGLHGSLPPELYLLTSLRMLDLSSNLLGGSMSSGIGYLSSLEVLILEQTDMTGTIATELGLCSNLLSLQLGKNLLNGTIPVKLIEGNFRNLRYFDVSQNQFTGTIPSILSQLSNLVGLYLLGSPLTGTLPSQLALLTDLVDFHVFYNQLTGTVPSEFGLLSELLALDLSWNSFTGKIPHQLGSLTNLELLSLGMNQLSGTIPTSLSQLSMLYVMEMMNNQLNGPLPSELGLISFYGNTHANMTATKVLKKFRGFPVGTAAFFNNNLSGLIPSELGQCSGLGWLSLAMNRLTGSLPSELGLLGETIAFDIAGNFLNGSIPEELANWPEYDKPPLHALAFFFNSSGWNISGNEFVGTIPPALCYRFNATVELDFDCSETLCGCDHCQCLNSSNHAGSATTTQRTSPEFNF